MMPVAVISLETEAMRRMLDGAISTLSAVDCDVYYTTTLTVTKVKLWIYESQNVTVETGDGYTGELVDGCYTIEFNCGQEIQCYFNEPYIKSGAYRSFCINVPITGLDGYSMLIEFTAKEGYYFLKHENSFSLELQFACMLFPGENVESSHSSGDTIILYLHDDMQILFEYHEKGTENEIYNALQEKTYGVEID